MWWQISLLPPPSPSFSPNHCRVNNFKQRTEWYDEKIKSLEESGLSIKSISQTIKNEAKEQKGGFLGMLLGTLGASLLGNLLTGNGIIRAA